MNTQSTTKYSQFGSASHNDRRFRPETPRIRRPKHDPATDAMVAEYDSRDFDGYGLHLSQSQERNFEAWF